MDSETIELMTTKVKLATKGKIHEEREAFKLRNFERSMSEELFILRLESDIFSEQLEEYKEQISQARYQLSMIQICTSSERAKIESHVNNLGIHKKSFDEYFERERTLLEKKNKEIREKEEEKERLHKLEQLEVSEKRDRQAKEVAALEFECDAIEKECAVLKKRNNAIMLKLRRKLVETEDARRELMKSLGLTSSSE